MSSFAKPRIIVSKCLEFEACRYNGDVISDHVVKKLNGFVEFIPVCPEVEIGLGIPRETLRLGRNEDGVQLIQLKTGQNLTNKMINFSSVFLEQINEVDGSILKSKSPSCGLFDTKIYENTNEDTHSYKKGRGLFAEHVLKRFPYIAVEDEGRLRNYTIREHFYTKIFTLASFREVKNQGSFKFLLSFQANNKYLFMALDQVILKKMGKIAANTDKNPFEYVVEKYEDELLKLLSSPAKYTNNINVCEHILGYFKKQLTSEEKEYFLSVVDQYRNEKVPLSTLKGILKSWVIRFGEDYLINQTFFEPYPEELVEISDSGKGRNLR